MSTMGKAFYAAFCDYPGCDGSTADDDYGWFEIERDAIDSALGGDWVQEDESTGERLFCERHLEQIHWLPDEPDADEETPDQRVITLPDGEIVALA